MVGRTIHGIKNIIILSIGMLVLGGVYGHNQTVLASHLSHYYPTKLEQRQEPIRTRFFLWSAGQPFPVLAQESLEIESNLANLDFPNSINFLLKASIEETVSEVTLEYGTNARSCVDGIARQEADLVPGDPFLARWEWDFIDSGSLPTGAEVWWKWEVRSVSGEVARSERQTLIIEDPGLSWQRIEDEQVLVVWSEGSQVFGRRILDLAKLSLDELSLQAGIRPDGQVRLTVYPTFESLQAAGLFLPEWTGGLAFPAYGVIMLGIPPDSGEWMNEVVPHEIAHLVTGERVFNCLGTDLPTWLGEGLSVFSESPYSSADLELIRSALESNTLPPLHALAGGFPANADATTLAYAQSGEVVRFLIREYGPQKMAALLAAIQSGKRINPALQEVYGVDTDGVDNLWRSALDFAVNAVQTAKPTLAYTMVPTRALWTPVVRASSTPESTVTPVAASPTRASSPPGQAALPGITSISTSPPVTAADPEEQEGISNPLCPGGAVLLGALFLSIVPLTRRKKQRAQPDLINR